MTIFLTIKIVLFALMVAAWLLVMREDRRSAAKRDAEFDEMMNRYTSYRVPLYYGTIDPEAQIITMQKGVDYE